MNKKVLACVAVIPISILLIASPFIIEQPEAELHNQALKGMSHYAQKIVITEKSRVHYSVSTLEYGPNTDKVDIVLFTEREYTKWITSSPGKYLTPGTSLNASEYAVDIVFDKPAVYYLIINNPTNNEVVVNYRLDIGTQAETLWWFCSAAGITGLLWTISVAVKGGGNNGPKSAGKYYLNDGHYDKKSILDPFKYPFNIDNKDVPFNKFRLMELVFLVALFAALIAEPFLDFTFFMAFSWALTLFFLYLAYVFYNLVPESASDYSSYREKALYVVHYYAPFGQLFGLLVMSSGFTAFGFLVCGVTTLLWVCVHLANETPALESVKSYVDMMDLADADILEKSKQIEVSRSLELVEDGLTLIGLEHPVDGGRIDILARDALGHYVVIELKREYANYKVVGQIEKYIFHIENDHRQAEVRGIIMASRFDRFVLEYCQKNPNIKCVSYSSINNAKLVKEGTKVVEEELREALDIVIRKAKEKTGAELSDAMSEFEVSREDGRLTIELNEGLRQQDLIEAHLALKKQFKNRVNYLLMLILNRCDGREVVDVMKMKLC